MISTNAGAMKEKEGSAVSMTFMKRLVRLLDGCDIHVQFDRPQAANEGSFSLERNALKDNVQKDSCCFPGTTVVVEDPYHTQSLLHLQRFNGDELVSGSVLLSPRSSSYAHLGIRIELRGIITVQYAASSLASSPSSSSRQGAPTVLSSLHSPASSISKAAASPIVPDAGDVEVSSTFLCQVQTYEAGTIQLPTRFPFQFGGIKPFESYVGHRIQVHYMIYFKMFRSLKNISHREYIFVTWPTTPSLPPSSSSQWEVSPNNIKEGEELASSTTHPMHSWEMKTCEGDGQESAMVTGGDTFSEKERKTVPGISSSTGDHNSSNHPYDITSANSADAVDKLLSSSPEHISKSHEESQETEQGGKREPNASSSSTEWMGSSSAVNSVSPMLKNTAINREKKNSYSSGDLWLCGQSVENLEICSPLFGESVALDRLRYEISCRHQLWPRLFESSCKGDGYKRHLHAKVITMGVREKVLLDLSLFPLVAHLEEEIMGEVKFRKVECQIESSEISLMREEFILSSDYFRDECADGFDTASELKSGGSTIPGIKKEGGQNNVTGDYRNGNLGGDINTGAPTPGWQKEVEKLQIFEILDGCPADGTAIPFRIQLASIPHVTPTYDSIYNNRASVKYYLSLTIITKQKRYFKEQEIKIYRRNGQECTTRPQLVLK